MMVILMDIPIPEGEDDAEPVRERGVVDDPSITPSERAAMLAVFVRQLPKRMEEIQQTLRQPDHVALRRAAHSLAGAAGLFGFNAIARCAQRLSQQAQPNAAEADAARLADLCQQALTATPQDPS
jgi:HPt (histidine-containing phosphotransfer) domain-containing protein